MSLTTTSISLSQTLSATTYASVEPVINLDRQIQRELTKTDAIYGEFLQQQQAQNQLLTTHNTYLQMELEAVEQRYLAVVSIAAAEKAALQEQNSVLKGRISFLEAANAALAAKLAAFVAVVKPAYTYLTTMTYWSGNPLHQCHRSRVISGKFCPAEARKFAAFCDEWLPQWKSHIE